MIAHYVWKNFHEFKDNAKFAISRNKKDVKNSILVELRSDWYKDFDAANLDIKIRNCAIFEKNMNVLGRN